MRVRSVALLVLLLVAPGCASLLPPSGPVYFEVTTSNDFGDFTLKVFDGSGLVTGIRSGTTDPLGWRKVGLREDAVVRAFPERAEVEVAWVGGACAHGPTLTVSGSADDLHLKLEPDVGPRPLPFEGCPFVGIFFGLTLTLSAPVDQALLTLEVL